MPHFSSRKYRNLVGRGILQSYGLERNIGHRHVRALPRQRTADGRRRNSTIRPRIEWNGRLRELPRKRARKYRRTLVGRTLQPLADTH